MLSAGVTNVSKNRQVRRAVIRSACRSPSDTTGPLPAETRLAQYATAGDAIQAAAKGAANTQVPDRDHAATANASTPSNGAPAMRL